jgi:dephospho-CoA kinase
VADLFTALGAVVVDSDALAHELTACGETAMPRIAREFGDAYLQADGALDRKAMRHWLFPIRVQGSAWRPSSIR